MMPRPPPRPGRHQGGADDGGGGNRKREAHATVGDAYASRGNITHSEAGELGGRRLTTTTRLR